MVPSARLGRLHPPPPPPHLPTPGECASLINPVYLPGLGNGCVCVSRKTAQSWTSHHPCTPHSQMQGGGGASQSLAQGSQLRLLTFRPIFLPDVQSPLSLELFRVSCRGILHSLTGVKGYPPSTPACWDPSAPRRLTHTQIPPAPL